MSENVYGEMDQLTANEFVPVSVHVHVDDLASFYTAIAQWWQDVDGKGAKGRLRVA
ncbi:hypothetical protein [Egicoccus sp. AB-alg6-2]|uniref:hypothetical protein n=1 Tax=Egicoccus sp. AB-alg6-2 TaxID=3242692 RepID=UPI00359EC6B4